MRIALVGKGGSGKSSVSWLLTKYFSSNKKVLAIDADYNMDLMHNLNVSEDNINFLKKSEKDIYDVFDLAITDNAFKVTETLKEEVFSIFPEDDFTKKYSKQIDTNLALMVLGDHDDETMYSGRCSHAYAKAIKFYLPYLKLAGDQVVIIDSVAGTDMVNYGLYLGVDVIFCVVEDTKNSVMVMNSAQKIAQEYNIPFFALLNKSIDNSKKYIDDSEVVAKFSFDPAFANYDYQSLSKNNLEECKKVEIFLKDVKVKNNIIRLQKWKEKNKNYII